MNKFHNYKKKMPFPINETNHQISIQNVSFGVGIFAYLSFSIFWNISVDPTSCDWTGTLGHPLANKDTWSCCSTENKCTHNEGDCDSNNDCEDGLVCGIDNCQDLNPGKPFPSGADCCSDLGTKAASK